MYFVTGTDTDCGKTLVSSALLYKAKGRTLGFKPIASGCEKSELGLRNSDALSLLAASSVKLGETLKHNGKPMQLEYQHINPYAFEPAIAPHIAAQQIDMTIEPTKLLKHIAFATSLPLDFCLIEGAGGWHLPLGGEHLLSHVVKEAKLSVILVVGVKLGCLNHALLTQEALVKQGVQVAGWVANCIDPNMPHLEENLQTLSNMMLGTCLGVLPYLSEATAVTAATYLTLPQSA
ncbi:dethiobiotin synthase [uncultured Shewanella sp.]|uniref:dethiobiotin synthase n=1 Tax=uncultured Shewanella sp. TaxID=173975 RepID=UPI00260D96C9|nr:dethiobiotin synthase [uncultured Shewanella sp.]